MKYFVKKIITKPIILFIKYIIPKKYGFPIIRLLIPKRCTNLKEPFSFYSDGSWIHEDSTSDQIRIESYLNSVNLKGNTLLQVGVGNSSLGRKFSDRLQIIDGITIVNEEKKYADSFSISNYHVKVINKYSQELLSLKYKYDIIVDNVLSSYACCIFHFLKMLENYIKLLKTGGLIITDKEGLEYISNGFGLTYEILKEFENNFPIKVSKVNKYIIRVKKLQNSSE